RQRTVEELALASRRGAVELRLVGLLLCHGGRDRRLYVWGEAGASQADQVARLRGGDERLLLPCLLLHVRDQAGHAPPIGQRRVAAAHRDLVIQGQQGVDLVGVLLDHRQGREPGTSRRRPQRSKPIDRGDRGTRLLLGQLG